MEATSPGRRFVGLVLAWALLLGATPGALLADGSWLLAAAGLGLWGAVTVRPLGERRRRALLAEWGANALGTAGWMWWVWWVVPIGVLYIGVAMGAYVTLGGLVARGAARRLPPGVAVALAWLGAETLRTVLPPPFGLGWFLLGHATTGELWLAGSARVWGVEGLTLVVAAVGGLGTELLLLRRARPATLALAAGSLAAAALLARLVPPPATVDGPRVLAIQPSIAQDVKQAAPWLETHDELLRLTVEALGREVRESARGPELPPVDLVCWGETMLRLTLFEPEAEEAVREGLEGPPWRPPLDGEALRIARDLERTHVDRRLLRHLPGGVSFLAGAIVVDRVGDRIVQENAVLLWDEHGKRGSAVAKRFLVPGAETMLGLERFAWARDLAWEAMRYVPDFHAAEETGVLELATRDGRSFGIATTVCFDNAFLEAYVEPVRDRQADLHLVVSNEAWYRDAFEMDQMLAFSRVAAIATGRSVVRVTNSGVTTAFGPDGRELGRLVADGLDRSVAGGQAWTVPVPETPGAPPYVWLRGILRGLLLVGFGALVLLARAAPGRQSGAPDPGADQGA